MTLIVSDISAHGIIMVGDSAVTRKKVGQPEFYLSDAIKVQYCEKLNIGVSMWGYANLKSSRMDYWLSSFLENDTNNNDNIESVGERMVDKLNSEFSLTGKTFEDIVCGIHITGFKGELPCLYHIHRGHHNEPPHELRLYHDFPEDQRWSEAKFKSLLQNGFIHLRNGYHPLFGPLFANIHKFSIDLRSNFGITFPSDSLSSRFDFYKLLIKFIADVLPISGLPPRVNSKLSAIAFTKDGLAIDERLAFTKSTFNSTIDLLDYF
jgi:hypothetical protein